MRIQVTTRSGVVLELDGARPSDIATVVAIHEDAMERARRLGYNPGSPPRPLSDIVAERISHGAIYLAYSAGEPVATVTLKWESEPLWHDLPGNAMYVHGLMVRTASTGTDVGGALLRWAERQASMAGRAAVRLDCIASNHPLRAYYERAGYTYHGDVTTSTFTGSRFEKMLRSTPQEGVHARDR